MASPSGMIQFDAPRIPFLALPDLLTPHTKLWIAGPAGSGKTTLFTLMCDAFDFTAIAGDACIPGGLWFPYHTGALRGFDISVPWVETLEVHIDAVESVNSLFAVDFPIVVDGAFPLSAAREIGFDVVLVTEHALDPSFMLRVVKKRLETEEWLKAKAKAGELSDERILEGAVNYFSDAEGIITHVVSDIPPMESNGRGNSREAVERINTRMYKPLTSLIKKGQLAGKPVRR
jgi:hypothetical protein